MARIRIVETHRHLIIERMFHILHSRLIYIIVILVVAGSSLLTVSQLYHPTVYTNISNSKTHEIYNNSTETFFFATDASYVTNVTFTFPSGNAVSYSVSEYSKYKHNGEQVTHYSLMFQRNASNSFSFNLQNRNAVNGRDYVLNVTAISGNRFNATMTYTIIMPNIAPTNPYVELAGIALIFLGVGIVIIRISNPGHLE